MRLVMTLLVRDEEDIVAANIDFHRSRGTDFFIVTDNLSVDGTPAILREYERAGIARVIRETADDYAQHAWVTRMARLAAVEHAADWVINCDADEFWMPDGGADLKSVLAVVPGNARAASAPRMNFPLRIDEPVDPRTPFAERMTWKDTRSVTLLGAPLPGKVCHRGDARIDVGQGNHAVSVGGTGCGAVPLAAEILHFPMRSYAQFERKIRLGGAAYERNKSLAPSVGKTWRAMYAELQAGRFEESFRAQVLDADRWREQLAEGRLVPDTRLRDALRRIGAVRG